MKTVNATKTELNKAFSPVYIEANTIELAFATEPTKIMIDGKLYGYGHYCGQLADGRFFEVGYNGYQNVVTIFNKIGVTRYFGSKENKEYYANKMGSSICGQLTTKLIFNQ